MSGKKEVRPALESRRTSVKKDGVSIPRKEFERGSWAFAGLMLLTWCAIVVCEVMKCV